MCFLVSSRAVKSAKRGIRFESRLVLCMMNWQKYLMQNAGAASVVLGTKFTWSPPPSHGFEVNEEYMDDGGET